jgi:hypothetical protein
MAQTRRMGKRNRRADQPKAPRFSPYRWWARSCRQIPSSTRPLPVSPRILKLTRMGGCRTRATCSTQCHSVLPALLNDTACSLVRLLAPDSEPSLSHRFRQGRDGVAGENQIGIVTANHDNIKRWKRIRAGHLTTRRDSPTPICRLSFIRFIPDL